MNFNPTESPAKNPKRVEAGRRNRKKRQGLSEQGRQLLREAAHRNRPWDLATGPKTSKGKLKVVTNLPRRKTVPQTVENCFAHKCAALLRHLKDFQKIEFTDKGAIFIAGFSEDFFSQADRFVQQQAERERNSQKAYLDSLGVSQRLQEQILG